MTQTIGGGGCDSQRCVLVDYEGIVNGGYRERRSGLGAAGVPYLLSVLMESGLITWSIPRAIFYAAVIPEGKGFVIVKMLLVI